MPITIKAVTIADLSKIAPIFDKYRVFYKQESDLNLATNFIKARLENNQSVIFAALDSTNEFVGFTQLYPSFSSVSAKPLWILNDLYVDKSVRRQGIGQKLMQAAKEHAIKTNANGLMLETAIDNKNAQALYLKEGYELEDDVYFYGLSL